TVPAVDSVARLGAPSIQPPFEAGPDATRRVHIRLHQAGPGSYRARGRLAVDAPQGTGRRRFADDGRAAPRRGDDPVPGRTRDDRLDIELDVVPARPPSGSRGEARFGMANGPRPPDTHSGC